MRMPVGRVWAQCLPSSTIASVGSPVIAAAGRRKGENSLPKAFPADSVLSDERPILLAFDQHDMQQAEGECGIRSGDRRGASLLAAAVRVRIGSMQTTAAPFFRGSKIGRRQTGMR